MKTITKKLIPLIIAPLLLVQTLPLGIGIASVAAAANDDISNASLSAKIGDLGQIEELYINNNPTNKKGNPINFVLPNNTSPQNNVQHQWMGEMIFSYRTGDNEQFPDNRDGFVEVDTNKTLAAGGSTTYSNINPNNPYIEKTTSMDGNKVEVNFIGQDLDSTTQRAMKGFDVNSVFDMDTEDGSMLWEITLKNKSSKFIEFGDVGLPMPWNNKYLNVSDTYDNRLTVHNFAGADSGYSYAIRTSGEGNFMMFTPVPESGARIEYVDYWLGDTGELRNGSTYSNWVGDSGGWFPGLNVLYIHSKDIQKTGRGYFSDASSLILGPEEEKTYQFKFSAVRAGDNDPQMNAASPNNASNSMEDREANLRSILYKSGMIDAVALPGFQTAINMPTKLALHYDDSKINVKTIDIQSVHENDPFDATHIPVIKSGQTREKMVNNTRGGRGLPGGNPGYSESVQFVETKIINGEQYHIYSLTFDNIGNNSVRVEYELDNGSEMMDKFTQFEFNVLTELDETVQAHSEFMVDVTQDKDPSSPTFGIYRDHYLTTGIDMVTSHWGDDWSHDNINFMAMKNYLDPDPDEIRSIENYLIDFMWNNYMKNTQKTFMVANYLKDSGIYTNSEKPYVRTFSEAMEATGYFNMYRVQKAYPNLIEYRESPQYYLEKAYGIYYNRVDTGPTGFYGEQQIPDMIEALKEEGMLTEYENLKKKFAKDKATSVTNASYPYGSEFEYDNTGEEGAYAAAKAMRTYYPEDPKASAALKSMEMDDLKTRAMRGIQPTWYFYSVPVFRAGEGWWNFQYTASLAGSIMDDWLRYDGSDRTPDQAAIAQQRNYAAKISNFNAVNMGQISAQSIGGIAWRYNAQKGGTGTKDVYDGGTRVMNNGWQDFSGESEEGLYGSLLRISSDIVTDPVFGLFGYGALVTDESGVYHITPKDGFGKRINLIDEKIYLVSQSDKIERAQIQKDGSAFTLQISNLAKSEHASRITFDGAGVENGYYTIKLDGVDAGQFYAQNNKGVAMFQMSNALTAELTIEKLDTGENQAPQVTAEVATENPQAMLPFMIDGIVTDDGAPNGALTYQWEVVSTPEGGSLSITNPKSTTTKAVGTKGGSYTVKLIANDGHLTGSNELTFVLAAPPEKQPPVIGDLTVVRDDSNNSILMLSGTATPDPIYSVVFDPELTYSWTVKQQPTGSGDITIINSDKVNAVTRISKAGTYVFTFTAADEDKTASKDITIDIDEDTDGSYRAISVVTQKGTVPTLPSQVDVLTDDGYVKSEIVWDAVDPAQYANDGVFVVQGNITDSEFKVNVTVYVVKSQPLNNALTATPSAIINTVNDLGGVKGLNDGFDPIRSSDTSHGAWHNWQGDQGGPAWIKYEWSEAFLATSMDVYVFRDGGGSFQPTDMKLQLRDENGKWYTPRAINGLGNELNKYNTTTFEPAYITGARIDMKPVTVGSGILEWKVNGYTGGTGTDKTELAKIYNFANSLKAANFTGQGLTPIADAKMAASAMIANKDATEEEVAQVIEKLLTDMQLLTPLNNNAAFSAIVSASFTSTWESLPALNDGLKNASTNPHWGTWGNAGSSEWVQYDWPQGATIQSSNLMLWTDGGGISAPTKLVYSYIPKDSSTNAWVTLDTISTGIIASATPVGSSNIYGIDPVLEVKALRVTMTKKANNGEGVGLWEWEVIQPMIKQDQTAPTTPTGVAPTTSIGNDGKLIGVTAFMEYKKEGAEQYSAITGVEVTNLTAGKYFVRYMKTDSLNASPDKEVVIPEWQKQDQAAPDKSGWTITNANSETNSKGKIEGLNNTMEYRQLGEVSYSPVSDTSIENLEPGSYQIRYAATELLNASQSVTVVILNEAKDDRDAPNADDLVITPPTIAGGNDGKIENVTVEMEYRKVDGGAYTPISGNSIENLKAGSYEIRYAETGTENPSSAIVVVIPDGAKQEQNPPSNAEVRGVNVSVIGAMDGKITGVVSTMEYQKQGADSDVWMAITGVEIVNLDIGTYYVRYKETATHKASDSLTVIIGNSDVGPTNPPTLPQTPDPVTNKVEGDTIKVVQPKVDKKTGIATVPISQEDINKALKNAKENSDGVQTIRVEIPQTEGASAYSVELPQLVLTSNQANMKVEIVTEFGTMVVPANMLKAVETGEKSVELTISMADTSKLDPNLVGVIGNRPVIELGVKIEGTAVAGNSLKTPMEIKIPYTPTSEELANSEYLVVWYIDEHGKHIQINNAKYDAAEKAIVFTTTYVGKYAVAYTKKSFSDVTKNSWYETAVETMASKGFIDGTTDTSFSPDNQITRSEYLAWLVRTLGLTAEFNTNFSDVLVTNKYYDEIGIAKALGITVGYNGKFNYEAEITRQDMAVMTIRALQAANKVSKIGTADDLNKFTDAEKLAKYASEDMATMIKMGFINGQGNNILSPTGATTRAEAAQVLYNIYLQQ